MSINMTNPTTLLELIDAAANHVSQIRIAAVALDKAETEESAKPEGVDWTMAELIRRAVEHPQRWERGTPRWSAVGATFRIGSTSAVALCKAFGQKPEEIRKR